jgi:ferredoxin
VQVHIAIIGSSLSSWAVVESITPKLMPKDTITLIDANKRFANEDSLVSPNGLKTKFGSSFAYDTNNSGIQFSGQSNYSMAHGGFSNTWGAGIRLWDYEDIQNSILEPHQFYDAAVKLLQKIPYSGTLKSLNIPMGHEVQSKAGPLGSGRFDKLMNPNQSVPNCNVSHSALAINVEGINGCRGCGLCLSGCPYGSIFETSSLFDEKLRRRELELVEGIVSRIEGSVNVTKVFYRTSKGVVQYREFDRVYICAGAIGTPAILMRSNLLPAQVMVADSQVFYFFGLSYFRIKKESKRFALSQVTLTSNPDAKLTFTASLYSCNADVRKRISELISINLFGLNIPLPKILDRILFLGIGFIDSSESGRIQLDFDAVSGDIKVTSLENKDSRRSVKEALKVIAHKTRKSKMYTSKRFFQMPSPGAGFHSGAATPLDSEFVSSNGSLRSLENVFIGDVSILPFLKPGPHTFTSMVLNSALIADYQK